MHAKESTWWLCGLTCIAVNAKPLGGCDGAPDDAFALPLLLVLQAASAERSLQDVLDELSSQARNSSYSSNSHSTSASHVCVSSKGIAIQPAHVASTSEAVRLQFSTSRDSTAAGMYAQQAASKAAALNADASNAQRYTMGQQVRVVCLNRCFCQGACRVL
jgi:hypothetical protein